MGNKWIPREVDKLMSIEESMERLNRWIKNPDSDPELEEWYKFGASEGLDFEVKKPEQWELDHDIYFPMYEKAKKLEEAGKESEALEIYSEVHNKFIPRGTTYYDRPIWLFEKRRQFDMAIDLCEKAINAISQNLFNADIELYKNDIQRFQLIKKNN